MFSIDDVQIRQLEKEECEYAAAVIARAFRDNPTSIAVLGHNPVHRVRCLMNVYRAVLPNMSRLPVSAWHRGHCVGVLGVVPPGTCQLTPVRIMRMLPWMVRSGTPAELRRGIHWNLRRDKFDLDEPHWHLEPGAVEPALASQGIMTKLMNEVCDLMDREQGVLFGLTERLQNVGFFERFDGILLEEVEILGVKNWALRRNPKPLSDRASNGVSKQARA